MHKNIRQGVLSMIQKGVLPIIQLIKNIKYCLTYGEWAILCWWSFAIGCCISYGNYYEYSLPMVVFLSSSWLLCILIVRRFYSNNSKVYVYATATTLVRRSSSKNLLYMPLLLMISFMIALGGYMRTESVIWAYNGINRYYMGAAGQFVVQLASKPEVTIQNGEEKWKFTGDIKGFMPDSNDIHHVMKAKGFITIYVNRTKQQELQLFSGNYIVMEGEVLPVKPRPEAGRMDMKARYISSGQVGFMYDGTYKGSLTADDVEAILGAPTLEERWLMVSGQVLGSMRQSVTAMLSRELPSDLSHLSESLLLGGGYGVLDETIVAAFAKTGLIHILSVSGSHVALLFGFVFFIGRLLRFNKRQSTYGAIGIVILYCALVGYNPPVVRSALMGILMGIGILQRKEYVGLQALHLSALALLIYDPLQLMDISFQLSFGATYGLMLFARTMYQSLPKHMPYIMGPVSLCVSAQLIIWPLQIYYFHLLGVGSLLAAVVAAPLLDLAIVLLMGLIVITGLLQVIGIGGAVSFLWSGLGMLLQLSLFINESIATMPGLVYWSAALSLILWMLYNMALYGLYYGMHFKRVRSNSWEIVAYSFMFCLLCVANIGLRPDGALRLHTIPLSRGAAFIVMKERFLKSPEAMVYVELDGKEISSYSRVSIINSCHYYGVAKPEYIVLANVPDGFTNRISQSSVGASDYEINELLNSFQYSNNELNKISNGVFSVGEPERFRDVAPHVIDGLQVSGIHKSYIFKHRQTDKKTLKLNKDAVTIWGTADEVLLQRIEDEPFVEAILYFPRLKQGTEIDPADEKVYKSGERSIPDFLL